MSDGLRLPAIHHVGIVVADVTSALADFERNWGVPRAGSQEVPVADAMVSGKKTDFTAHYGFLAAGETQIELISPVSGDSPYATFLRERGEGLHHLAFVVASIDKQIEKLDQAGQPCAITTNAEVPGLLRFVYAAGAGHGALIELIEMASGRTGAGFGLI
jgi:catechol 2,3-dioxygenase-like lactoylglutathione lyase family enzyme